MAVLEYYAFEAGRYSTKQAKQSYRRLARKSFRNFIYQHCGYDPANTVPTLWQPFHDRASLLHNTVPEGYFGVFHAIHDLFIALGQNSIHTNMNFMPDISVGISWSTYWQSIEGDIQYGKRIRYEHTYPLIILKRNQVGLKSLGPTQKLLWGHFDGGSGKSI